MSLTAIVKLVRQRQMMPALKAKTLYRPFYKLTYIAGAKNSGLLDLLHDGPRPFDDLAKTYGRDAKSREALGLEHLKGFLKPGGFLLLTSCCQGGNLGMDALNLWSAATAGGGRLPEVAEMRQQLIDAGYTNVVDKRLVPGDSYYAFCATLLGARPRAMATHLAAIAATGRS